MKTFKRQLAILIAIIMLVGLIPSNVFATVPFPNNIYGVQTGTTPPLNMPSFYELRYGQIWTGKTVEYPETFPNSGISDGTAIITIFIWGRPLADGGSILEDPDPFVTDDVHIKLEAQIGDFSFIDDGTNTWNTAPANVDFTFTPATPTTNAALNWLIDEVAITDPTWPLEISYHILLEDRLDWRINYWYTTAGSYIEVKFQPNMSNPFYWTKYEETAAEFTATVNWNNGGGINSATITDNILNKTITFGSNPNKQPEGQDSQIYTLSAYPQWWTYGATVRSDPTIYWWHLNWTKGSPKTYYITVHGLITDVDGTPIDVIYKFDFIHGGGNTAFAAGRYLVSEKYFRRILDEDGNELVWDEEGNLVFREHLIAEIKLLDANIPTGTLDITKNNIPGIPGADWYLDGEFWEFNVRIRAYDVNESEYMYAVLLYEGSNTYRFAGFDYIFRATPIVLTQSAAGSQYSHTVTILDLPKYSSMQDFTAGIPLGYEIVEFFTFNTLGLLDVYFQIDGNPGFPGAVATPAEIQPGEYEAHATSIFNIVAHRSITLRNIYEHGIGFVEVHKLLDGFPGDWGVDTTTQFYVRIFDMDAGNYLWFFEVPIDSSHTPFLLPVHWVDDFAGTWWCVGNHEKGLTTDKFPDNIRPILELPISVAESIKTSNLWTGIEYRVVEVKRADGVVEADTTAIWNEFWDLAVGIGTSNRDPIWIDPVWNSEFGGDLGAAGLQIPITMGESLQKWLEDKWIYNTDIWQPVRVITDDAYWHSVPIEEWYWGVVYPADDPVFGRINPTQPLRFNQTANVTITNRYKFKGGELELQKVLGDHALAWGIAPYTMFHVQLLTDEIEPRALVFVPEPKGQEQRWRVVGYMGLNSEGIADPDFGYQVLCPVGSPDPPVGWVATIKFSANKPVTLIEIPTFMSHGTSDPPPISYQVYLLEEVFPDGMPVGLIWPPAIDLENISDGTFPSPDAVPFPHLNIINGTITNNFMDPTGNLVIFKELAGHYASWGVDEETIFWVAVYHEGFRVPFFNPEPFVYVYKNYINAGDFIGLTPGPLTEEVAFRALKPTIVIGLDTSKYMYPEIPYEVVELRVDRSRFTATGADNITRDDNDNLFVTITNTFVRRPGGGNGGGTPPPDENNQEQRTPSDFFVDEHIWYIRGYEDTTIRPNNNITRAEVAMAFYRLLRPEMKNIAVSSTFSDVRDDAWYGRGVSILAHHEIFTGYEDGTFRPNASITRRELAAVVSRFDELIETNVNPYRDVYQNDWARRYILSATQKGWFIGYDGLFRPSDRLTRAEFVTAVNRVLVRHILLEDVPADVFNFPDLDRSHWAYTAFMEAAHTHEYARREDGKNEIWTQILGTGLDAAYNE